MTAIKEHKISLHAPKQVTLLVMNHASPTPSHASPPAGVEGLFEILVVLPGDPSPRTIEATTGFSAMELIRASGVPIKAECGGAGVCATCHCRVPDNWMPHLPRPTIDELEKIDELPAADDRSRLACQIHITDALAGLILELQPDSVANSARGNGLIAAAE
jgi:ferredoxin, 2Fe-2S